MRITEQQRKAIVATVHEVIPDGRILLFGSRADDTRRGGDIDLFVETDQVVPLKAVLSLEYELASLFDIKVDLLVKDFSRKDDNPIYDIARAGVALNEELRC